MAGVGRGGQGGIVFGFGGVYCHIRLDVVVVAVVLVH